LLTVASDVSLDVALATTLAQCFFKQSTHDRAAAIVVANELAIDLFQEIGW
jgi:hypothetical protein